MTFPGEIPQATSRGPCFRCGIPGFKGCAHQSAVPAREVPRPLMEPAKQYSIPRGAQISESERDALLQDIEDYLDATDTAATVFGYLAVHYGALVGRMRAGIRPSRSTVERVRQFMETHPVEVEA